MSRYVINILASRDLNDIAEYFATHSVEAGEKFFLEFNRRCEQLVKFPNLGKSYAEIRPNLRGLPLKDYVIFYRLVDDGIEILRVLSGRRNFTDFFQESE
ncbi:MAG: type II toxin-antitoxin system RelE/ParE family toxin [Oscillatoriaceae cyanobacterium]